jgi:hypothetical protein
MVIKKIVNRFDSKSILDLIIVSKVITILRNEKNRSPNIKIDTGLQILIKIFILR